MFTDKCPAPWLEIRRDRSGTFYFILKDSDWKTLMTSQPYATEELAKIGAERVIEIVADAEVWRSENK